MTTSSRSRQRQHLLLCTVISWSYAMVRHRGRGWTQHSRHSNLKCNSRTGRQLELSPTKIRCHSISNKNHRMCSFQGSSAGEWEATVKMTVKFQGQCLQGVARSRHILMTMWCKEVSARVQAAEGAMLFTAWTTVPVWSLRLTDEFPGAVKLSSRQFLWCGVNKADSDEFPPVRASTCIWC